MFVYIKSMFNFEEQTQRDMKLTEKQKVVNKLVKNGNNLERATEMVNEHYEYVSKHYSGVAKMANVIICL